MGLVGAVVGILAEDYDFDGVKGCVAGPKHVQSVKWEELR